MKIQSKYLWILLLAALLMLSVGMKYTLKNQSKLKEENISLQEKLMANQLRLDYMQKMINIIGQTDTLFATGQFEKALDILSVSGIKDVDSLVFRNRKLLANKIKSGQDSLKWELKEKNNLHQKLKTTRYNIDQEKTEIQQTLSNVNDLLNECRAELEQLNESFQNGSILKTDNATDISALKIINIFNTKGNEIYYLGNTENGMANGYGAGLWKKGGHYTGDWKDNNRHGKGKYFWADGENYEGDFVLDKREGYGKYTWKNGIYFIGHWKADKRHGDGILYEKNGKVRLRGVWKDDEFVKSPIKTD